MGFLGHWTSTHDIARGVKIWLDGRPMFLVIARLEDSRVSADDREAVWQKCVTELLRRMNEDRSSKETA